LFSGTRSALAVVAVCSAVCVLQAAVSQAADPPWSSPAVVTRVVQDNRINEASGLTRSTYARPVLFVHNDSGDSARFFAISSKGRTRGVFTLRSAPSLDWEDTAAGPKHTLWFGDIGDNASSRSNISVIRVTEPVDVDGKRRLSSTTFRLEYPDGPHNAEALMVRPNTGRVFVVTKAGAGAQVYKAPETLTWGEVNQLTAVADAPRWITGGDFSPNGAMFVLRSLDKAYFYDTMGDEPTMVVDLPDQRQGESIGFNHDGDAVFLGSEGIDQPIWRVDR